MDLFDQIIYKNHTVDKFEHPSLAGRYEIHCLTTYKFVGRVSTIKEAKNLINSQLNYNSKELKF